MIMVRIVLVETLVILSVVVPTNRCTSVVAETTDAEPCSTWFFRNQEGYCQCGSPIHGVVSCDNATRRVSVLSCFCMTLNDDDGNSTVIGSCLLNCANGTYLKNHNNVYHRVSPIKSELDKGSCNYLNRRGRLCSKCIEGHYISAYSYDFHCYNCTSSVGYNVVKYIFIAYIPLTMLYLFVLVFHISATSPKLNAFVVLCQSFATPVYVMISIQATKNTKMFPLIQTLATIFGVWNLDFFRTVIPPICLPLHTFQILALDYLVALYPLLLIIVSYALLTAYDKEISIVVWVWRPFQKCLARFRRPWNIRYSIIDAFATFLLFSYMKLLTTSTNFLMPVSVYNVTGEWIGNYLYYDASIPFFKGAHLIYASFTLLIVIIVIIFPLILLLLYPMNCFQKCLNRCGLNFQGLRFFMECFQGCFRDKTDGGMECRYFAAVYPFTRIISFVVYGMMKSDVCFVPLVMCLTAIAIAIIVVQPYKETFKVYNKLDSIMMLTLALHFLAVKFVDDTEAKQPFHNHNIIGLWIGGSLVIATAIVPHIYICIIVSCNLFSYHWFMYPFSYLRGIISQILKKKYNTYELIE